MNASVLTAMPHPDDSVAAALPVIQPDTRVAINAWLKHYCAEVCFAIGDRQYRLGWEEPSFPAMRIGAELTFGSRCVLLALEHLGPLDPLLVGDPFMLMPASLRDIVLQRMLAQVLAALPAVVRDSADLRAIHWTATTMPQWECAQGFALSHLSTGSTSRGLIAAPSPADLEWLRTSLPASGLTPRRLRPGMRVPIRLQLGETRLDRASIDTLEAGDVVWISTAHHRRDGIAVNFRSPYADVTWNARIQRSSLRIWEQRTSGAGPNLIHSGGDMSINETHPIEIPVTFDLGELSVTLQELEHLQPGHLFELPQEANSATVHLRVAGQVIAAGRLVAVGRRLGVRMTDTRALREPADETVAIRR
ncbi:MAG TPA: type III secretion system cytoplasmic ring protein SctQ [Povalibacter sp.]